MGFSWRHRQRLCALVAFAVGNLVVAEASAEEPRVSRETFVVQAFTNQSNVRSLDHLRAGLPVLIAERLALQPPLRFVGGSGIFSRAPQAKWIVEGSFE